MTDVEIIDNAIAIVTALGVIVTHDQSPADDDAVFLVRLLRADVALMRRYDPEPKWGAVPYTLGVQAARNQIALERARLYEGVVVEP